MEITEDKRKGIMTLWSFCFQKHLKGIADAYVEIQNQIS
jgi:hypothetical protein